MKKKYMLLLELLIALSLFALCVPVFVANPFMLQHNLQKKLVNMELERLSELVFVDIKSLLYQKKIAWNVLELEQKDASFVNYDQIFCIDLMGKKNSYSVDYKIFSLAKIEAMDGSQIGSKLSILITFRSQKNKKVAYKVYHHLFVNKYN
ncbi:MAG: hypothetical protein ACOVOR_00510 [Rhabdochlamydiaceae bacterium]